MINKIIVYLKNLFGLYSDIDKSAVIACYYNFEKNPYRLINFNIWFDQIKDYNFRIIELVLEGDQPELPVHKNISVEYTTSQLWHKETLFNKILEALPLQFEYIFWFDTDVILPENWFDYSMDAFKNGAKLIQPFSYAIHLEQDQLPREVNRNMKVNNLFKCRTVEEFNTFSTNEKTWFSFARRANQYSNQFTGSYSTCLANHSNFNVHGHTGFAWGAKREIFDKIGFYDKALIGSADHIMAHAAISSGIHSCIEDVFKHSISDIAAWTKKFHDNVNGQIGYCPGTLYHIWHGNLRDRDYYERNKKYDSIVNTAKKDSNGYYHLPNNSEAKQDIKTYFKTRENIHRTDEDARRDIEKRKADEYDRQRREEQYRRDNDTLAAMLLYNQQEQNRIMDTAYSNEFNNTDYSNEYASIPSHKDHTCINEHSHSNSQHVYADDSSSNINYYS